jgi:ABC-type nitrate/sulfonate/bicarbonate transport system permease component
VTAPEGGALPYSPELPTDAREPAKPAEAAGKAVDLDEELRLKARRRERLMSIASPVGLLLAWDAAARLGAIDVRFFPAPSAIILVMIGMLASGELMEHVLISLQRIALGFVLGAIPAIGIGIAMGISRSVRALLDPLIVATYPIPKSAILPFILLIFGLGEMSKVVMVAIGVFFPVAINATAGVLQINPIYLDVGKSFKASRWDTFRTIALPGALPFIMTGMKLGAGLALILIAIAEMVGAKTGIGYLIWSSWETFAVAKMYVGLFVIALIGFGVSFLLREIERWVIRWKPED